MILKNRVFVTDTYKGKSKFPFFQNIRIGDLLEVSTKIHRIRSGGNGLYATTIFLKNLRTEEVFDTTMNMAAGYLDQIKYNEI